MSRRANAVLRNEWQLVAAGIGDAQRLREALGSASLLVPTDGQGSPWVLDQDDLTWIPAFTSEVSLAAFMVARGHDADAEVEYLERSGAELYDVLPSMGGASGLAVDLASSLPMLFPHESLVADPEVAR